MPCAIAIPPIWEWPICSIGGTAWVAPGAGWAGIGMVMPGICSWSGGKGREDGDEPPRGIGIGMPSMGVLAADAGACPAPAPLAGAFFVTAFFVAAGFLAVAFFFGAGFFTAGFVAVGIVMPGMDCAIAGAAGAHARIAEDSKNRRGFRESSSKNAPPAPGPRVHRHLA